MSRSLFSVVFLFCLMISAAQSVGNNVVASDNVKTESKIVNWSIGHIVTAGKHTRTLHVYPGALTPSYYFLYNEVKGDVAISCFPNPAKEYFFLELKTNDFERLRWEVYKLNGEKIKEGSSDSNVIRIDIAGFNSATYYLNVFDQDDKRMSTAKILKK